MRTLTGLTSDTGHETSKAKDIFVRLCFVRGLFHLGRMLKVLWKCARLGVVHEKAMKGYRML